MPTFSPCPFSAQDIASIKKNLLANIATTTHTLTKITKEQTVIVALPGTVVAAQATPGNDFSQDYYFYWTRDGAVVMREIAHLYESTQDPAEKNVLKEIILNYLIFVDKIQSQPPLNNVNILGEPKFNVDGTLWTGQWARPQNDGAAYQAITLAHIARILLEEGKDTFVSQHIYGLHSMTGLLKSNLEYIASHWNNKTIGTWEELYGFHFSVEYLQRFALIQGGNLARQLNDNEAADYYFTQASHIGDVLSRYWDGNLGYLSETLKERDIRGGGIGALSIISLVYGRNAEIDFEDPFILTNEKCLSTVFYMRYLCEGLYQLNVINKEEKIGGPFIGRYLADVYDGNQNSQGNPWFLCTNLLAAFYYMVAIELLSGGKIHVTFLTRQFLNQLSGNLKVNLGMIIDQKSNQFQPLVIALVQAGDTILKAVKQYCVTNKDGTALHMSEQIHRVTGKQCSALDLSWSYASLFTALRVRKSVSDLFQRS